MPQVFIGAGGGELQVGDHQGSILWPRAQCARGDLPGQPPLACLSAAPPSSECLLLGRCKKGKGSGSRPYCSGQGLRCRGGSPLHLPPKRQTGFQPLHPQLFGLYRERLILPPRGVPRLFPPSFGQGQDPAQHRVGNGGCQKRAWEEVLLCGVSGARSASGDPHPFDLEVCPSQSRITAGLYPLWDWEESGGFCAMLGTARVRSGMSGTLCWSCGELHVKRCLCAAGAAVRCPPPMAS